MDLDDEELAATRVMHGLDKKDGSDINVGSIEEDIKILENLKSYLNLLVYEGKDKIIYNDLFWDEKTVDCIIAIEHLLRDYTRQNQINEEHQKINGELREKVKELEKKNEELEFCYKDCCKYLFNIKQRIKDLIKKYEWATCNYDCDISDYKQSQAIGKWSVLQELLKESEDKK